MKEDKTSKAKSPTDEKMLNAFRITCPKLDQAHTDDNDIECDSLVSSKALRSETSINPEPEPSSSPAYEDPVLKSLIAPTPDLPDNFESVAYIGDGGMSYVYSAIDNANDGIKVAVKVLREELCRDPEVIVRFEREATHAQQIENENTVRTIGMGRTLDGIPFIVSEYVDGGTLEDAIIASGRLKIDRSIEIFKQLCSAIEAAHEQNIVHRDIKPSNILLSQDDQLGEIAKLSDFGIIKAVSRYDFKNDLTGTGIILGSPAYMSPEQCRGEEVDQRSDIYSLGCVMYETLTGVSPFAAETPTKAILRHLFENPAPFSMHSKHKIPSALEDIVMKCLEKKPQDRYQRIEQLKNALSMPVSPAPGSLVIADLIDFFIAFIIMDFGAWIISSLFELSGVQVLDTIWTTLSVLLFVMLFYPIYFALFESSPFQTTPGKALFGLKVCHKSGWRLNLFSAFIPPALVVIISVTALFILLWLQRICFYFLLPQTIDLSFSSTITFLLILVLAFIANAVHVYITGGIYGICQGLADKPIEKVVGKPVIETKGILKSTEFRAIVALTITGLVSLLLCLGALLTCMHASEHGDFQAIKAVNDIKATVPIKANDLEIVRTYGFLKPNRTVAQDPKELIGRVSESNISKGHLIPREFILP